MLCAPCPSGVNNGGVSGNPATAAVNGITSPGVFIAEHDVQSSQHLIPVGVTYRPFFADVYAGKVQHFHETLVVGKTSLVFCDLAVLPMQSLNDIGRIYDFPNFGRIFKES